MRGHDSYIHCLAFSPDGRHVVSGSLDATVLVWDLEQTKAIGRLSCPGRDIPWTQSKTQGRALGVLSVAYSPDGRRIITGSSDGVIRVWDATGAWRRYDPASDVWGYNLDVTRVLLERLKHDLQPAHVVVNSRAK